MNLLFQANEEGNHAAQQAAERNQPRRAAARAYQSFKNQDDYFSDSPPDSADEEERQVCLLFVDHWAIMGNSECMSLFGLLPSVLDAYH